MTNIRKGIKNILIDVKYKLGLNKLGWMKVFLSPFRPPVPVLYVGKIAVGVPYMLPRVWVKDKDDKTFTSRPKKFGFDIVPLGYKWKYYELRHEWNPVWSFVIGKYQIAVIWKKEGLEWESYLTYEYKTDKALKRKQRLEQCREIDSNVWTRYANGEESRIDYFLLSLKRKWRKKFYTE